jgi:hypothetical protein
MADTVSRKWSVVIAHVVTGIGILAQATSIGIAMPGSCALVAWAGITTLRSRPGGPS